jgi:hypothetical protein
VAPGGFSASFVLKYLLGAIIVGSGLIASVVYSGHQLSHLSSRRPAVHQQRVRSPGDHRFRGGPGAGGILRLQDAPHRDATADARLGALSSQEATAADGAPA